MRAAEISPVLIHMVHSAEHPEWNVVCTDDKSAQYFVGTEGKDWAHQNTATHTVRICSDSHDVELTFSPYL